jgi:uncharacterized protein with ATP-grasp and redox domains
MEPLNPIPQCIDCLLSMAKNTALLAVDDRPGLVEKTESAARTILAEAEATPTSSPEIANHIIREIRRLTKVADPYIAFKAREMVAPAFFLFKVKCEPIRNYIQAPANSFLALWKKGT